jgi:hypothetical protein
MNIPMNIPKIFQYSCRVVAMMDSDKASNRDIKGRDRQKKKEYSILLYNPTKKKKEHPLTCRCRYIHESSGKLSSSHFFLQVAYPNLYEPPFCAIYSATPFHEIRGSVTTLISSLLYPDILAIDARRDDSRRLRWRPSVCSFTPW